MRGGPTNTSIVVVKDEETLRALRSLRRTIDGAVREGLSEGVQRFGLPAFRRRAPGRRIPLALSAGSTTRSAFVKLDKKAAPHAGILNFGGIRRDVVEPKQAHALLTPMGPRARVRGPRRYRAQHFLERARDESRPLVERHAEHVLISTFERYVSIVSGGEA